MKLFTCFAQIGLSECTLIAISMWQRFKTGKLQFTNINAVENFTNSFEVEISSYDHVCCGDFFNDVDEQPKVSIL